MSSNAAATLERANDYASDYENATIAFGDGTTTAVVHTITGLAGSNSGNNGVVQTPNLPDVETIVETVNPVTECVITAGGKTETLSVGLSGSGADVIVSSTNFIAGQPSTITNFAVNFPA